MRALFKLLGPSVAVAMIATFVMWSGSRAGAQDEAPPAEPAAIATEPAAPVDEATAAPTEEAAPAPTVESVSEGLGILRTEADTLWICLAAFLVFFMQAGFCAVECGFTRAKNACNICMKNLLDFCLGSIVFWAIGFGLMFGTNATSVMNLFGTDSFFLTPPSSYDWGFLIFQTVFCATAATIVSGAMAERTKFGAYLIYTIAITAVIYPVFGGWAWGSFYAPTESTGILEKMGFMDFAGSTVVHSIGGWCALAGALVVGPRLGRYVDGKVMPIPGHSIPLGAMGVFILWLGWFGFNPGSTTVIAGGSFAMIAVTTNLAAAAGAIGGMCTAWIFYKKPDPSFTLNGTLAGLVAITAGCNVMSPTYAIVTGLVGGVLVVFACTMFDKLKIDDPVGAISVHGVCGAWGTLAVGLFAIDKGLFLGGGVAQTIIQLKGIGLAFVWAFFGSLGVFLALKYTVGLRVSEKEEIEGLDIGEHGMSAYPAGFLADTASGSPSFSMPSVGMPVGAGAPAVASPN